LGSIAYRGPHRKIGTLCEPVPSSRCRKFTYRAGVRIDPGRVVSAARPVISAARPAAGAALVANALRPISRNRAPAFWSFVLGWHVSELPLVSLAVETAATGARLVRKGPRDRGSRLALASLAASAAGVALLEQPAWRSSQVLEQALVNGLGPGYRKEIEAAGLPINTGTVPSRWALLPPPILRRSHLYAEGIVYGPAGPRNQLDIWRRQDLPAGGRAPVLVQVPGGGWVIGDTRGQAYPLMSHLVEAGWVCVPISYRLSPRATFPDHLIDVKRALAWVKENIAAYGGDPRFVAITGGSAGGHLSSLAALSAGAKEFQPGFEDADTGVQAAVPFYGVYDLRDWNGRGGPKANVRHVQRFVLKRSPEEDPELWREASPISWVGPHAPPMMLVHGTNDSLAPVEGARRMAAELSEKSRQAVVYAELPFAQHAFDVYASLRTRHTVLAVERFLNWARARQLVAASSSSKDSERAAS
jgi:acetyl esterase/lipase